MRNHVHTVIAEEMLHSAEETCTEFFKKKKVKNCISNKAYFVSLANSGVKANKTWRHSR